MGRKSKLYYGDNGGTRMRKKKMLEKLQAARSKRQNIQKRRDNAGTSHENDNEVSQLPLTSTTIVDKELEIPETQSEILEVMSKCDQMMTSRDDISEEFSDELHDYDISMSAENPINEPIKIDRRRIIDFQHFLEGLIKIANHNDRFGCTLKNLTLLKENKTGFLSKFFFQCNMCNSKFELSSHDEKQKEKLNVNEGAVSGAIISGIGLTNLNEVAASMDLPVMSLFTYSKCHDKVADMWKNAAEESMFAAAQEETAVARLRGDTNDIPMIPVEADCCWSKRSYKNQYNALSGVAAIHNIRQTFI